MLCYWGVADQQHTGGKVSHGQLVLQPVKLVPLFCRRLENTMEWERWCTPRPLLLTGGFEENNIHRQVRSRCGTPHLANAVVAYVSSSRLVYGPPMEAWTWHPVPMKLTNKWCLKSCMTKIMNQQKQVGALVEQTAIHKCVVSCEATPITTAFIMLCLQRYWSMPNGWVWILRMNRYVKAKAGTALDPGV